MQISTGLNEGKVIGEYLPDEAKGVLVEELLTEVCTNLSEVGGLLDNKADLEFLLQIVGSYLISKEAGTLDKDVLTPSKLFEVNLIPMLRESRVEEEQDGD